MECTQRLDFENSQVERICPEQIGFLGILGTKYPVMRGPNKIGRDPQTCSIVLNKNSISRQHAVINVLNGNNYMLMDLDSANKTKLNNKSLQAFIPVPLTNGDTVQFGEVFGMFRLLEEETDDLPCTQAIDIPDTPVVHKNASRVRQATIPESPDVSDKDDSFMMPSQPKTGQFKSLGSKFVKSAARTVTMPAIGSNKIDNIFWSSSKKSHSFNLDDSNTSFNESSRNGDIHEADTQPHPTNEGTDSIYTAATQLPTNDASPSIYSMNTQIPVNNLPAVVKINNEHEMESDFCTANKENDNNIFNAETQCLAVGKNTEQNLFEANTQLPEDVSKSPNTDTNVFEANTQFPFAESSYNDINKPLSEENKLIFEANTQLPFDKSIEANNNGNIFEAKTQMPFEKLSDIQNEAENLFEENTKCRFNKTPEKECAKANRQGSPSLISTKNSNENVSKDKMSETPNKNVINLNKSDEVIAFNDLDTQDFLNDFQSQTILGSEPVNENVFINQDNIEEIPLSIPLDSITDEDVVMNQDDDSEVLSQIKPTKRNHRKESGGSSQNTETSQVRPTKKNICIESDDSTDCEDINMLPTQKIPPASLIDEDLTDLEEDLDPHDKNAKNYNFGSKIEFEDLLTQVIPEAEPDKPEYNANDEIDNKPVKLPCFEDIPTQVIPEEAESNIDDIPTQVIPQIDLQDLNALEFSQKIVSPFKVPIQTPLRSKKKEVTKANHSTVLTISPSKTNKNEDDEKYYTATQEILEDLCSQQDSTDSKSACHNLNKEPEQVDDNEGVPCEVVLVRDKSTDSSDEEAKIKSLTNLSDKQISDIIGVDISKPKKANSDPSDVETTPKKLRPFKFMQTELPDSQEIKTSVSLSSRTIGTESSSESENEKESQEQTPIVFRKKRRTKKTDVIKDLIANFDVQALPTRIITRTRKPSSKVQESDVATRKLSSNILKPNYLTEQDDDIDKEIISENITRLKSKTDKKNTMKAEESSRNDKAKIKEEPTKKRRPNKALNNNKVIDLTHVDNESSEKSKVDAKSLGSNVSADKSDDKMKIRKTRSRKESKSESIDAKSKPERKSDEAYVKPSKSETRDKNTKKETQGKITDYTFSNIKEDESKDSSTSKVNESSADINKSTRSTRNKNKVIQSDENKSEHDTTRRTRGRPKKDSQENNEQKDEDQSNKKPSKRRKKEEIIKEPEDQPIRRSTRQKTKEPQKLETQPKINRTHEQSTVYNISSESGSDSPRALKRSGGLVVDVPSPKRTRSVASINNNSGLTSRGVTSRSNTPVNSSNSSLRSTPAPKGKTHYVLFTAFPLEEVKGKLESLGAVIVSDVASCTVVLTVSLRRTFKLLCAVGLGRPIVGPHWVQACVDTNTIVDPWQYLLKDEANESRFKFSLARTLSGPRHYLKGYNVSATPSVQPGPAEMKVIVECSGGRWQESGPRWVVVTCGADRALWPALRQGGATVVSTEFILSGVLKQELDVSAYLIR